MTKNRLAGWISGQFRPVFILSIFFMCLLLLSGVAGSANAGQSVDEMMADADRLFAEGTMDSLKASAELYRQAAQQRPGSYEALWKGARACRTITRLAVIRELKDLKELSAVYGRQGMEMAEKAVALEPEKVEGHFYYAVNVGGYAKGVSIWTIFREGLKAKASEHLHKAYSIDKGYEDFVLVMHMGLYYEVLPWFAGQDKEKALKHYLEALRLMPADAAYRPQLHVLAGKLMLDQGVEEELARRILRETANSNVEYFSGKARQILSEYG